MTLRRAWPWVFPAPALLCGCSQESPDYWQGYVEGDYIYVSPAASGTLLERNVIRGDRVQRGAPLFRLEQEREIAIRDEARARLQSALASLELVPRRARRKGHRALHPPARSRKQAIDYDRTLYRQRHRIETMFGRPKDWRRVATCYDRGAHTFFSAICIAATVAFWLINESRA